MISDISLLQNALLNYPLTLPNAIQNINCISLEKQITNISIDPVIKQMFPHLINHFVVRGASKKTCLSYDKMKIGVVLSGGQASGGHNVIAGVFDSVKSLNPDSEVIGFLSGPGGVIDAKYVRLDKMIVDRFRNQGGFDMLGSGRTKIESKEQLAASLQTVQNLALDGLIVIGGDDSNTNAAVLAEYFQQNGCNTTVVGVPKTIDGDLQNDHVPISFGFDSACKVYSEMIGNIAADALSAKKYYHFVKLMGRSASHIALECALSTRINHAIMAEEVAEKRITLSQITAEICDMICKRSEMGKDFGVILIPEGLIEFIPEIAVLIKELNVLLLDKDSPDPEDIVQNLSEGSKASFLSFPATIQKQLLLLRDPHGNVQVSMIETERLLIESVSLELKKRKKEGVYKGKFSPVQHFFGYEGRAGLPSAFDAHYCYCLGLTATILSVNKMSGYMAFVENLHLSIKDWSIGGIPIVSLMNLEERKGSMKPVIKKALLNLKDKPFTYFVSQREIWKYQDLYRSPGPIQFFGDESIVLTKPHTLLLRFT